MSSNNNSSDKSSVNGVKVIFDNQVKRLYEDVDSYDNLRNSIKKLMNITDDSKQSIKLVSEINDYEIINNEDYNSFIINHSSDSCPRIRVVCFPKHDVVDINEILDNHNLNEINKSIAKSVFLDKNFQLQEQQKEDLDKELTNTYEKVSKKDQLSDDLSIQDDNFDLTISKISYVPQPIHIETIRSVNNPEKNNEEVENLHTEIKEGIENIANISSKNRENENIAREIIFESPKNSHNEFKNKGINLNHNIFEEEINTFPRRIVDSVMVNSNSKKSKSVNSIEIQEAKVSNTDHTIDILNTIMNRMDKIESKLDKLESLIISNQNNSRNSKAFYISRKIFKSIFFILFLSIVYKLYFPDSIQNNSNNSVNNLNESNHPSSLISAPHTYNPNPNLQNDNSNKIDDFIGQLKDGKRHGEGNQRLRDNIVFKGNFVDDKKHGKGEYYYNKQEQKYQGTWVNDKKVGIGKIIYKNGDYVEKDWDKDNNNNDVVYYFISGEVYKGSWINSKRNGYGVLYNKDKKVSYEGEWLDDKPNGKGVYIYDNGKKWEGTWKKKNKKY